MIEQTSPISFDTMLDLRAITRKFESTVSVPIEVRVGKFAVAYAKAEARLDNTEVPPAQLETIEHTTHSLISTEVDAISIVMRQDTVGKFVGISLPEDGQAFIIDYGDNPLLVSTGAPDDEESSLTPLRLLSEDEGRELVKDVRQAIEDTPPENRFHVPSSDDQA